jgi:hypothetical protein
MVGTRFPAMSKTMDAGDSNTSAFTSSDSRTYSPWVLFGDDTTTGGSIIDVFGV